MDCLFCKIANHELQSNIIYEDDLVVAFDDIKPQAPQHKLIIPRKHIATLNDVNEKDKELISHIIFTAQKIAHKLGIDQEGYRVLFNCNRHGGQEVHHLHLHLLGGRQMHWPPG
jgi:histidine triad (HIT) family protein